MWESVIYRLQKFGSDGPAAIAGSYEFVILFDSILVILINESNKQTALRIGNI